MADISSRLCGLDFVVGFTDGIRRAEELAVKIDFIMTAAVLDGEHRHHSFLLYSRTVKCRAKIWTCCAMQVRTPTASRIRLGCSCAVKSCLKDTTATSFCQVGWQKIASWCAKYVRSCETSGLDTRQNYEIQNRLSRG